MKNILLPLVLFSLVMFGNAVFAGTDPLTTGVDYYYGEEGTYETITKITVDDNGPWYRPYRVKVLVTYENTVYPFDTATIPYGYRSLHPAGSSGNCSYSASWGVGGASITFFQSGSLSTDYSVNFSQNSSQTPPRVDNEVWDPS